MRRGLVASRPFAVGFLGTLVALAALVIVAAAASAQDQRQVRPCADPDWLTGPGERRLLSGERCRRPIPEIAISAALRQRIVSELALQLRDVDATRFRWLPRFGSSRDYCSLINPPNGFGGYNGFQYFHVRLDAGDRIEELTTDPLTAHVRCTGAGYESILR